MGELKKETIYLSLGSNLGDRVQLLSHAIQVLKDSVGELIGISNIYESAPVGFDAENDFLNLVVSLKTTLAPFEILAITQQIEQQLGRKQKSLNGYSSRPIDIDIIFIGNCVIKEKELTVPHASYRERKFVLLPLIDLVKNFKDPVTSLTTEQLLLNCNDDTRIDLFQIAIQF